VANLSLIGINIGVILTCARGILTANKRLFEKLKTVECRQCCHLRTIRYISHAGSETQISGFDAKKEENTGQTKILHHVLAECLNITA